MLISVRIALACFVCVSLCGEAEEVILQPRETRDYDTSLDGGHYLALHRDASKQWRLTPAIINVSQLSPDLVRIESSQPNTLVLLQHGALRPGTVRVANVVRWSYAEAVKPNEVTTRYVRDIDDSVVVRLGKSVAGFFVKTDEIQMDVDGQRSTFLQAVSGYYSFDLLWAGDLDGDDKIDWLIDISDEKSSRLCLYLSSPAKTNEFVVEAGCMLASG